MPRRRVHTAGTRRKGNSFIESGGVELQRKGRQAQLVSSALSLVRPARRPVRFVDSPLPLRRPQLPPTDPCQTSRTRRGRCRRPAGGVTVTRLVSDAQCPVGGGRWWSVAREPIAAASVGTEVDGIGRGWGRPPHPQRGGGKRSSSSGTATRGRCAAEGQTRHTNNKPVSSSKAPTPNAA